ncbi:amidohydrolase family protein [Collimonas sp. NPDC087041]|uniref:amidohydrolase family protein n=1 Tax=Collimonas sp. NPDC087041 TaxID=3363960 RepID=UPI00380C7DBC
MTTTTLSNALRSIISKAPQSARRLLIKGGTIVSMDAEVGNFAKGDLLIEGDKIVAIGPDISAEGAEIIDAGNMIVMPGMIDTHRHAWEGQLRRINPNSSTLEDYCNGTHFSFAKHYRPADMYVGNLLTALGCIDAGITTIIDNSHNARSAEHSDAAVEALLDAGIRAVHAPGAPLAGDWDKDNWPRDLGRLKAKYFNGDQPLVTLAMMSQIDREIWAEARKLELPIVTEFFGRTMASELDALFQDGLLGTDNIFNHCTDLPDATWEMLREAGVRVNVCPRSDAHYALEDGVCSYQSALNHGMKPGLSVDNESSYSGDLFMEMRVAFYLQRSMAQSCRHHGHSHAPAPVMMQELLSAATIDGAAVAGLADKVGSLTVGKQADIVMIRTDDINLYPSNNALGSIVHAAQPGNIDTVIIGGQMRKRFGRIVNLDMAALEAATEESRKHLFAETGYIDDPFAETFSLPAA